MPLAPLRRDLSAFVKAYDVRGVVPDQLDAEVAHALGAAFVIDALRPRGRVWATAGVVALGALVAVQLPFLIL